MFSYFFLCVEEKQEKLKLKGIIRWCLFHLWISIKIKCFDVFVRTEHFPSCYLFSSVIPLIISEGEGVVVKRHSRRSGKFLALYFNRVDWSEVKWADIDDGVVVVLVWQRFVFCFLMNKLSKRRWEGVNDNCDGRYEGNDKCVCETRSIYLLIHPAIHHSYKIWLFFLIKLIKIK